MVFVECYRRRKCGEPPRGQRRWARRSFRCRLPPADEMWWNPGTHQDPGPGRTDAVGVWGAVLGGWFWWFGLREVGLGWVVLVVLKAVLWYFFWWYRVVGGWVGVFVSFFKLWPISYWPYPKNPSNKRQKRSFWPTIQTQPIDGFFFQGRSWSLTSHGRKLDFFWESGAVDGGKTAQLRPIFVFFNLFKSKHRKPVCLPPSFFSFVGGFWNGWIWPDIWY